MVAQDTITAVAELQIKIESGKSIVGERIPNFICFGCDRTIPHGQVQASTLHEEKCLWRYFVHCGTCNYETSLAKCTGSRYECACGRP